MTSTLTRWVPKAFVIAAVAWAGCAHPHAAPAAATVAATKPDHEQAVETGIPVASTPQGLMKPGAEKRVQEGLRAKGLLRPEQCNGQLDAATRAALRKFQKSEGLPTTGLPSYETLDHLGVDLDDIFHTTAHPRDPTSP